jgi:hypothetical protein
MADRALRAVPDPESTARLADALMHVSVLDDLDNRRLCVREAMDRLRMRVSVTESSEKKIHVVAMVRAFGSVPQGWQHLTEAVQFLADYDLPSIHAASLACPVALPAFVDTAEQELRTLLADLDRTTVPGLAEIYHTAAGEPFGALPKEVDTAWEALQLLALTNRPMDGVPRPLRFLQALAVVLPLDRGDAIRAWVGRQVRRTIDDPAVAQHVLDRSRADVGQHTATGIHAAYLVIRLRPSVSSPDRLDVTCWTNVTSRWEPRRRDDSSVHRDEVRRHVALLVDREEARLRDHRGGLVLEFILPVSLLNEPVEDWSRLGLIEDEPLWASEHGGPPFWQDYTVVVRSLERLEALQLHRVWNERWDMLTTRASDARAHRCENTGPDDDDQLYLRLKRNPRIVLMALGSPPDQARGKRELLTGLHAGLPVVVWNHNGPLTDEAHRTAEAALGGSPGELLNGMARLRSFPTPKHDGGEEHERVTGVAVLWDDPNRLPEFPEPLLSHTAETRAENDRAG